MPAIAAGGDGGRKGSGDSSFLAASRDAGVSDSCSWTGESALCGCLQERAKRI